MLEIIRGAIQFVRCNYFIELNLKSTVMRVIKQLTAHSKLIKSIPLDRGFGQKIEFLELTSLL